MTFDESDKLKDYISEFTKILSPEFQDTVDQLVISSLSNMLSFHFASEELNNIKNIATDCKIKLKNYLRDRVIVSYDFSEVLGLFAVAISETESYTSDVSENAKKSSSRDAILNQISSVLDIEQNSEFRSVLSEILEYNSSNDIINYIIGNKEKTKTLYNTMQKSTLLLNKSQMATEMIRILSQESAAMKKKDEIKSSLTLACSIAIGTAAAVIATTGLGMLSSVAIIPITVAGVRAVSSPIETSMTKLTNTIFEFSQKNSYITQKISEFSKVLQGEMNVKTTENINSVAVIAGKERILNEEYLKQAKKVMGNISLEDVQKISKPKSPNVKIAADSIKNTISK
jgi:hypothetical protein